ncbi:MAG: alkaline phosphatase family protein [Ardenticatenaceae bacterium]|nr:alkaline phosphatase family protein [Ardenticatenaceae bacterium]
MKSNVKHTLLIDIDGLRWDVFQQGLIKNQLPNLQKMLGNSVFQSPITSTASSITFAAQASLITGEHPEYHGIPGNQFFDRFGDEDSQPRFYAFDMGETLDIGSAVGVFTQGLANQRLKCKTIFERLAQYDLNSVVATHMYAKGATWLQPAVTHLGRFLKGGNLLGMSPESFDQTTIDNLKTHIHQNGLPDLLMAYIMGLDFESHKKGPSYQITSLKRIDRQLGELFEVVQTHAQGPILTAVFSDHGQIATPPDDDKAIELGFPFGKELADFFTTLHLDVHDYPGEAPHCDAVIALNGGTAAVYLHNKVGHWWDEPVFTRDVQPIGQAFWDASKTGRYEPRLQNNLAAVLIRNVEQDGWYAPFHALTPEGKVVTLDEWFSQPNTQPALDPLNRIKRYAGPYAGDLMLVSNYDDGYYFGKPLSGTHGGLHPEDSQGTLAFGINDRNLLQTIEQAIDERRQREDNRMPSVVDLATGLEEVLITNG